MAGKTLADRSANLSDPIDPIDLVRALGSVSIAQHTATDPAIELAERAAREALTMAGTDPQGTPCIIGISKGATNALVAAIEHCSPRSQSKAEIPGTRHCPTPPRDADLAIALGPYGYFSHHLKQRLGIHATRTTVAACASSLTALHQARATLLHRRTHAPAEKKMLVVTAEASLLPLFVHSYCRLGVLPPLTVAQYHGRPLDQGRSGFVLAELAAAVVLEAVDQVLPGQFELIDSAAANEAYDLVRPAPTMNALSHIAQSLFADRQIDMLHPHATGTTHHDPAELAALAPHLHNRPDGYACKGALGHGLGAAGLVALVVACLCAKTRRRPPMPWLIKPIDTNTINLTATGGTLAGTPQTHAVFAAGFGGHVAGAVIRAH